jgi:hypothetical protein
LLEIHFYLPEVWIEVANSGSAWGKAIEVMKAAKEKDWMARV